MASIHMVRLSAGLFFSFISLSLQGAWPFSSQPQVQSPNTLLNSQYTRYHSLSDFFAATHNLIGALTKDAQQYHSQNALTAINSIAHVLYHERDGASAFTLQFNPNYPSGIQVIEGVNRWAGMQIFDMQTAQSLLTTLTAPVQSQGNFQSISKALTSKYRYAIRQKIKLGENILRQAYVNAKYAQTQGNPNTVPQMLNQLVPAQTFGQIIAGLQPNYISPGVPYGMQAGMMNQTGLMGQQNLQQFPNSQGLGYNTGLNGQMVQPQIGNSFGNGQGFGYNNGLNGQMMQSQFGQPQFGNSFGNYPLNPSGPSFPQQNMQTFSGYQNMGNMAFPSGQMPPELQPQTPDQSQIINMELSGISNAMAIRNMALQMNLLDPTDPMGNAKIVQVLAQGNQQNLMNTANILNMKGALNGKTNYEKAMLISTDSKL